MQTDAQQPGAMTDVHNRRDSPGRTQFEFSAISAEWELQVNN